jgi:hypothetical protein
LIGKGRPKRRFNQNRDVNSNTFCTDAEDCLELPCFVNDLQIVPVRREGWPAGGILLFLYIMKKRSSGGGQVLKHLGLWEVYPPYLRRVKPRPLENGILIMRPRRTCFFPFPFYLGAEAGSVIRPSAFCIPISLSQASSRNLVYSALLMFIDTQPN